MTFIKGNQQANARHTDDFLPRRSSIMGTYDILGDTYSIELRKYRTREPSTELFGESYTGKGTP